MYSKYLKYKHKYLNLKKLYGGENKENEYNRLVFSNLSCTVSPVQNIISKQLMIDYLELLYNNTYGCINNDYWRNTNTSKIDYRFKMYGIYGYEIVSIDDIKPALSFHVDIMIELDDTNYEEQIKTVIDNNLKYSFIYLSNKDNFLINYDKLKKLFIDKKNVEYFVYVVDTDNTIIYFDKENKYYKHELVQNGNVIPLQNHLKTRGNIPTRKPKIEDIDKTYPKIFKLIEGIKNNLKKDLIYNIITKILIIVENNNKYNQLNDLVYSDLHNISIIIDKYKSDLDDDSFNLTLIFDISTTLLLSYLCVITEETDITATENLEKLLSKHFEDHLNMTPSYTYIRKSGTDAFNLALLDTKRRLKDNPNHIVLYSSNIYYELNIQLRRYHKELNTREINTQATEKMIKYINSRINVYRVNAVIIENLQEEILKHEQIKNEEDKILMKEEKIQMEETKDTIEELNEIKKNVEILRRELTDISEKRELFQSSNNIENDQHIYIIKEYNRINERIGYLRYRDERIAYLRYRDERIAYLKERHDIFNKKLEIALNEEIKKYIMNTEIIDTIFMDISSSPYDRRIASICNLKQLLETILRLYPDTIKIAKNLKIVIDCTINGMFSKKLKEMTDYIKEIFAKTDIKVQITIFFSLQKMNSFGYDRLSGGCILHFDPLNNPTQKNTDLDKYKISINKYNAIGYIFFIENMKKLLEQYINKIHSNRLIFYNKFKYSQNHNKLSNNLYESENVYISGYFKHNELKLFSENFTKICKNYTRNSWGFQNMSLTFMGYNHARISIGIEDYSVEMVKKMYDFLIKNFGNTPEEGYV